jgi:rRNA maturation RNase YbeY
MTVRRKSKIYFFFEKPASLPNRTKLKKFIDTIFKKEKKKLHRLNYVFCADNQLLAINKEYLKHDYFTDVITFRLSPDMKPIEGEVYISIDRIRENALVFGESMTRELHRVIVHGALHLCGYRDNSKKGRETMRKKEDFYLGLYL